MLRPQSKGNEILDTITASIFAGELKLLPIQAMGVKRDIEKLDDIALKLHLKGIMAILQGDDVSEGIFLCERAISLNTTKPLYWNNYIVTLRNAGLYKKHNDFIEKTSDLLSFYPKILGYELFMLGVFALRADLIDAAISGLEKMGISIDDVGINGEDKGTFMLMYNNPELIEQFRPMVDCLFDVVDRQYKGVISTSLKKDVDGSMTYVFKVDLGIDEISTLNDQLFNLLYEKDLLSSDCCIYIEPRGEAR